MKNLPNARLDKLHRISAKCFNHLRKDTFPKSFLQFIKCLNNLLALFLNKTKLNNGRNLANTVPNAAI
jgi:hypothetical protein